MIPCFRYLCLGYISKAPKALTISCFSGGLIPFLPLKTSKLDLISLFRPSQPQNGPASTPCCGTFPDLNHLHRYIGPVSQIFFFPANIWHISKDTCWVWACLCPSCSKTWREWWDGSNFLQKYAISSPALSKTSWVMWYIISVSGVFIYSRSRCQLFALQMSCSDHTQY